MGASYLIAGRNVPSQYLVFATWATVGLGVFAATRRMKSKKPTSPPINASSADEETFIKEFLKQVEEEEKKKD